MWHTKKRELQAEDKTYLSVIDGVKKIYESKIKQVEQHYQFEAFHTPTLRDSDFDAKPMVLLLGQYSTGKSTFIKYLLERDFPGCHIGPEPTTDKFMAIYHGTQETVTPGHALAVQADRPFRGLNKFGVDFLNRFQGSQLPAPILEDLIFIDTPGVLSGEKQRVGRSYDFVSVCEWFADRADLILLLFDAHKLDISDEFKLVIEALKANMDKVRVVLNKADMVSNQQLMRVYGALMWSLGKVLQTPEVVRVYLGSFWNQPYQNEDNKKLFEAEQNDLLKELYALPKNAAVRKVNELVKRARQAKVHAYIVSHLRNEMPAVFGKSKKQKELLDNMKNVFFEVHKRYKLPVGDFPNITKFKETVQNFDFTKFNKLNEKMIESMDQVLSEDIPKLMKQFPQEKSAAALNPFESNNPFDGGDFGAEETIISNDDRTKFIQIFQSLNPVDGKISGKTAREVLIESKLPREVLSKIWVLADRDKDGQLTQDEFVIAMWLVYQALSGAPVPDVLPTPLQKPLGPPPRISYDKLETKSIEYPSNLPSAPPSQGSDPFMGYLTSSSQAFTPNVD